MYSSLFCRRLFCVVLVVALFCSILPLSVSASGVWDYQYTDSDGVTWNVKTLMSGSGSWVVPEYIERVDVLVVAGGGGSGRGYYDDELNAGGGGAGGLIWVQDVTEIPGNTIDYSIGAGGTGATSRDYRGKSGGDTIFGNLTAKGGGGGGSPGSWPPTTNPRSGLSGGSGGGAGNRDHLLGTGGTGLQSSQPEWNGTYGHGYNGSNAVEISGIGYRPGGGGGAGGVGPTQMAGGPGLNMSSYFGTSVGYNGWFASGGGANDEGVDAVANSGMGGRARAITSDSSGRAGGSGVVLIRWVDCTVSVVDITPEPDTIGVSPDISSINVTLECREGNTFNWSIETYPNIGSDNGTDDTNDTFSVSVSGLLPSTMYTVFVNVTDSEGTRDSFIYYFTTFGFVEFGCYDETTGAAVEPFGVQITNHQFYVNESLMNGANISIEYLPFGPVVTFLVSSDGYYSRVYTYSISEVENYNFSFFLPSRRDEYTVKSTSRSVDNPGVDLDITLDCIPEYVESVQGWNGSLYGHWFVIPDDKYSLVGDNLTVDNSVLDSNTVVVRVVYHCPGEGALQYFITVVDETDRPVRGARVAVQAFVPTVGLYVNVSIIDTDGAGSIDVYLIPDVLYRVLIVKEGYLDEVASWIPSVDIRGKKFVLIVDTTTPPTGIWSEFISMNVTRLDNCSIQVVYNDVSESTVLVTVIVSVYNGGYSEVSNQDYTSNGFSDIVSGNCSMGYRVDYIVEHSLFGLFTHRMYLPSLDLVVVDAGELEALFIQVFGEFDLGYVNLIAIFVLMAGLFAFGEQGAGVALLGTGFMFLFINIFIIGFVVTTVIPVLFIVLGFLLTWLNMRRKYE